MDQLTLLSVHKDDLLKHRNRAEALRQELEQVIGKLENVEDQTAAKKRGLDLLSDAAVAEYDATLRHRDLLISRVAAIRKEQEGMVGRGSMLGFKLNSAGQAVGLACLPGLELLIEKVKAALLPFCDGAQALQIAHALPDVNRYRESLVRPMWGQTGGTLGEVELAIHTIDQILEGRNPFRLTNGQSIDDL